MAAFTVCLTHDVDRVYKTYQYVTKDLRNGRIRGLKTLFTGKSPYWRFSELMELESRYGARSTYFFLRETIPFEPFRPSRWKLTLGRYRYSDPRVAAVIRELHAGGWEIGVHGSYNSFRNVDLLRQEKDALEQVLGASVRGIRQHYLNLDIPQTWELQRSVGFEYDASFGLRRRIGFPEKRYQPFVDDASGILVIPLALMEGYLFQWAANDFEVARKAMLALIDEAEQNSAVLTALWHPHIYNDEEFPGFGRMYEILLQECSSRGARFVTCRELLEEHLIAHSTISPSADQ